MKWIVKNKDGVLEFNSTVVCTESEYNRINAKINQQKIQAWCSDNHVSVETIKGEQCISVIKEITTEVDEREARRMDRLHEDFLRFVSHLPEVDSVQENSNTSTKDNQNENVKFVIDTLDGLHKNDVDGAILITTIGPAIGLPCGRISHKTLIQMCETWLDKYGNK